MKNIFKKISAIAASALMVGMTMGVAAAANYPAPFVVGGSANVAIVYGTGAGYNPSDLVQGSYVQSNLQGFMSGSGGTTVIGGNSWEVGTTSDKLELGESIRDIDKYIGSGEFGLLVNGEDKEITFLGKTYTIVTADNGSSGVELTLMSGALGGTVSNTVPMTIDGYSVSVLVSSASAAEFTINGETTSKMAKGDMEKLSDGNYLAVTDITYQGFADAMAEQWG